MRTVLRTVLFFVLFIACTVTSAFAQDIPEEYQERIRDLVERFEEARRLLREQIQRNSELYTQEEIDAAIADLEDQLAQAEARAALIEREYKTLLEAVKNAEAESLRYKEELAKTREDLGLEIETMQAVLRSAELEDILQIGPTFSTEGSLGVLGVLNLPGTNMGLVTQVDYVLREREARTSFGVTFSFLEQGALVEWWERFLARRHNRDESKTVGGVTEESVDGDSVGGERIEAETAEQAPLETADENLGQ